MTDYALPWQTTGFGGHTALMDTTIRNGRRDRARADAASLTSDVLPKSLKDATPAWMASIFTEAVKRESVERKARVKTFLEQYEKVSARVVETGVLLREEYARSPYARHVRDCTSWIHANQAYGEFNDVKAAAIVDIAILFPTEMMRARLVAIAAAIKATKGDSNASSSSTVPAVGKRKRATK